MLEVSSWRETLGRPFIDIDHERSERILKMVDEGWRLASAHPSVHAGAGEVEITECLRDGMRAALGERTADYRYRQMIVQGGTESRSSPEVLRPDGRTDVSVLFNDVRRTTTNMIRTRSSSANGSPGIGLISVASTSPKASTVS